MSLDELSTSAFSSSRSDGPPDDRLPPQDVGAEQSVLGGMLLSKDAIADCVEQLKGTDFYRPAHELIYDAILDLYGRGEPADAITVADELTKRGDLSRVGGQAYLHQLISSVPTAANAGYYAQIVAERAVLRRLVEAGTRIVQLGYAQGGGDVEDIVNAAQAEVYAVADKRGGDDYHVIGDIIEATVDEIEVASGRSGEMTGVPTGFTDLDSLTNGLHPGQMIVVAARPAMGKSTLGLDIARTAAIKHKMASVVFSLEMSRTEITMRLLSAEAGIQLQHMRKGTMREEDWTRLAKTMGKVSDAPLFIDDSPNMSLMEIRAKCRRLKQRHNLKLVIIDYLQLMSSGKRVESRQQEVSEFSRALKLLAKELEVPVIAISQLNRGPEQRTDKKPAMSDLRESGCLTAETRVLRADTGAEMSLGDLLRYGERDVPVWSLDESLRYVARPLTHVFSTGVKPVFRLTLASGKTVRATENHPFLTYAGWSFLGELRTGDRIAVPRHVPAPEDYDQPLEDDDLRTGALIMSSRTSDRPGARVEAMGCGIGFDVYPQGERTLPPDLGYFPKRQIGLFVASLWAIDGEVTVDEAAREGRVVLRAASRLLVDDVARLLLRFGISTTVTPERRGWALDVVGVDDQRRFLQEIAVHAERTPAAEALLRIVRERSGADVAGVSAGGTDRLTALDGAGAPRVTLTPEDISDDLYDEEGFDLERAAELFDSLDLDLEAANDVLWDAVASVEPDGVEEVFDATVLGGHNFIANGIAVHNSIEQDADMVILLHREAAYERDSPREGEADLIVAKHRNGPTDTIVVAFQGHFSRFTNMATNF
ncbi:MAG TPA: replicative DNA helicase [Intrasporangium sp.]|uniref:replicative DNA helicase n=1 Tax=Intrasporangium sp. TaxID=1925024 RepID=UPI002D7A0008|nr:replicative DNA helicase [Intrasporangium sp.]HET7399696.1 replicative DNA helicase [Intrasporangium sp.]